MMLSQLLTKDHGFWRDRATKIRLETGLFIDGDYRAGSSGALFESINPATGAVLAGMSIATEDDIDDVVQVAKNAFRSGIWPRLAPRERMAILFRFADLIEHNAADLALLESIDMGKPISRVLTADIPAVLNTVRYFAECIDKIEGIVTNTDPGAFHYVLREPFGVVAAITPWNFPMMLAMWKVAPALAAGNTVVLKPAEQAPLSCLRLAELFVEAGGPSGVFNVVNGPGEITGRALAMHPDVSKIAFTGSTEVGRLILSYAAQSNLKKVSLELGGKSAQIFLDDTPDLEVAAKAAVAGIFANSGQVCSAGSRLLVDRAIHGEFVELFQSAARTSFIPGDPLDPRTTMGPMVTTQQRNQVLRRVQQGKDEGAELRMGGDCPASLPDGAFINPTIFDHVSPEMTIAREEIFGPVVSIIPVDGPDEAIRVANDSIYGLAASVWTRDLSKAHRLVRAIEAGVVWVNCFGDGDMTQPFGGYKQSGQGRDCGIECLLSYTQLKSAWIKL
jgi:acyl-CoA reductase-like NAD-dependent aldehyde dehydrogenase